MSDILKALLDNLTEDQKLKIVEQLLAEANAKTVTEKSIETTEGTFSSNPRSEVNEDFTVNRMDIENNRKSPVKFRKNEWVDKGEDRDPNVDYEKLERTPRRRGKPTKKSVECHVCGKSFAMSESLIYGEFIRCNRCTGQ